MTDRHAEFLDLCAVYALGAIDEADRVRLEAHLAPGCPICEEALVSFGDATLALAMSVPAVKPDAAVKARVMAAISDRPNMPERSPRRISYPVLASLGWVAAALLLFAWLGEKSRTAQFERELAALTSQSKDLELALAEERGWIDSMSAADAKLASFATTPDAPSALEGWAVFDPSTRRAILVFENLQLPTDRDLELWAIRDGAPQSLGVIQVDERGRALLRLREIAEPSKVGAFAVSLEAKGGSPNKSAPSGPVVMVGAL